MTKSKTSWLFNSDIDVNNPDPELAALASEDFTTADFDLDAAGELTSHVRPVDLTIDKDFYRMQNASGVYLTIPQNDLEPRFKDWIRAVREILASDNLPTVRWPGSLTVTGGQATWEPDLAKAKGSTELLDKALADVWLLHNS